VINFIGIPFALPYFAAIDQILKANLATGDTLVLLVAYNPVYAPPFLVVPILVAALGERSRVPFCAGSRGLWTGPVPS